MARDLKQVAATGNIVAGDAWLHAVTVTATASAVVEIRDGVGTAVRLTLAALTGTSATWTASDPEGVFFTSAIHATVVSGTGTVSATFS